MSRGLKFVLGYTLSVFTAFILVMSACSAGDTIGGGGGGGGGGGSTPGLQDGTNYVSTTNVDLANSEITNTNSFTTLLINGYASNIIYEGWFTNEVTNWLMILSGNTTVTDTYSYITNFFYESGSYTQVLIFTFLTNTFDTTNAVPPLMISNVTTNSNGITGGFEVFVTNYGYITNVVSNWLAFYTNDVLTDLSNTASSYFEAVSNTYERYTNGIVTNAFDTTNFVPPWYVDTVSVNSNGISVGFEVTVTNFGFITNLVTNWLEEVVNGSTTLTWATNVYEFTGPSNEVEIYTNTFLTNAFDTTNVGTDIWVSNATTNSNSITQGYEVFVTNYGYLTNTVTNWLADYTNGALNQTWDTNSYIFLTETNETFVIFTNYVTNQLDTTNFYSSNGTNNTTNVGFVGRFWYTNIAVIGYFSNVITNWTVFYTDSVTLLSNYSNHYYEQLGTNYSTSNSNFGVHIGAEQPNVAGDTVALWNFNEGSGQTVADGSGNGRSLTLGATGGAEGTDPVWTNWYSAPGYGIGSYSNSLSFDASASQYAWWSGNYNHGNRISIGFWMRTTNNTGILLSAGRSNYQVHLDNNNIYFTVSDFVSNYVFGTSAASITNGKWHYIACTYPAPAAQRRIRIYIDGTEVASQNQSTVLTINNVTNIYVGGRPDFGVYFNGQIENVRILTSIDANVATYFTTATNTD